jgi:hypothetical protein
MLVHPRFIIYNHGGVALDIMRQIVQQIIIAHAAPHAPMRLKTQNIHHTDKKKPMIAHGNAALDI